ncbi:hypothetical protein BGX38DRAFT_146652 [Terfezia claveryi]|nr:hypothetical protein BGX38DRAFT_146652 [Terfezia claveryi]
MRYRPSEDLGKKLLLLFIYILFRGKLVVNPFHFFSSFLSFFFFFFFVFFALLLIDLKYAPFRGKNLVFYGAGPSNRGK